MHMHMPSLVLILVLVSPVDANSGQCADYPKWEINTNAGWKEPSSGETEYSLTTTKYTLGVPESKLCETVNRDCGDNGVMPVQEEYPGSANEAERETIRESFRILFCTYKTCLEVSRKNCEYFGGDGTVNELRVTNARDSDVRDSVTGKCKFNSNRRVAGVPVCVCDVPALAWMEGKAESLGAKCYDGYQAPTALPEMKELLELRRKVEKVEEQADKVEEQADKKERDWVPGLVAVVVSCCISGVLVGGLFFIMNQKKQSGPTTTEMTTGLSSA